MGVWEVPYGTAAQAKEFLRRMRKPWMAKIERAPGSAREEANYEIPLLSALCGSDDLSDAIERRVRGRGASFDVRPLVRKRVLSWIRDEEDGGTISSDPSTWNTVRRAVGLRPLARSALSGFRFKPLSPMRRRLGERRFQWARERERTLRANSAVPGSRKKVLSKAAGLRKVFNQMGATVESLGVNFLDRYPFYLKEFGMNTPVNRRRFFHHAVVVLWTKKKAHLGRVKKAIRGFPGLVKFKSTSAKLHRFLVGPEGN